MSWRLLAEVRDRDFNAVTKLCAAEPGPLPFNSAHGKLLMLLLAEWCNDDGEAVYPRTKAAFASACQISERQVQRLFAGFLKAGLVDIEQEAHAQAKSPRIYRIIIDELLDLPLTEVAKADRQRRRRARDRDRTADRRSPQRENQGRATGNCESGTGDQQFPQRETESRTAGDCQSGRGDQQSPTTPITPKEPLGTPPLGSPPHDGPLFGGSDQETEHASKRTGRGTRLESDWQPPTDAWAFGRGLGLTDAEVSDQLDRFRDYWIARPGQGGRKVDWNATFRNWLRRAADDRGRGANGARNGNARGGRREPVSVVAAVGQVIDCFDNALAREPGHG